MDKLPVVIVGSGLAGYTLAREFRKLDAVTPLTIISSDHADFYSKPMLSNALAQGKTADALVLKNALQMATELNADIRGESQVNSIDHLRREIVVNGETIKYRDLVLALGADPIHLPLKGNAGNSVLSVNNLDDYRAFRDAIRGKKRITILGAGLIGCEFANDLASAGYQIGVVDLAPQVLGRLLPSAAAHYMQQHLEGLGIVFHLGTSVQSIEKMGNDLSIRLENGVQLTTELVLSAVGLKPRTMLATSCGIEVNRGIVVNGQMKSSVDGVYALGDCAEMNGQLLPFVMPLMHAARALAQSLSGRPTTVHYPVMPISVKTPACPAVIALVDQASQGCWDIESQVSGIRALFKSGQGNLSGFALLGSLVSEKQFLIQQMSHVV